MDMSKDKIVGKWTEIKGEVRKAWGKLTEDELEQTKGDITSIKGLLQQKYGQKKEDYHQKLSEIISRYDVQKDQAVENVKAKLK